ncbi:hypothetical protein C5Y96_12940 [Blastopirellula marina]|uniref:Carboxypeptidase regulatory-like domain-containing protein n=1 Tax=Blastopirellula marina TaxID=124 RepID=A0A2S8FH65_9BACT|nr:MULTISPECIES: hypothetical protein [Pirellulaceae]PQO31244.1 hypothetical protein C5Y96_12940 [Blastopirellula marina]RCS51638.1 hypothetical protein DTL36_12950 [Bremerella cremea]
MVLARYWPGLVTLVLLAVSLGCNSKAGLATYPVSGTVTYQGKPVPDGSITLIPDSRQGNSGAAVSIDIVNGKFDSATADRGHVGGPHMVRVVGLDGKGDGDLFPHGQMLFPDYETTLDLPKEGSTQEIVVPIDLKMPRRR